MHPNSKLIKAKRIDLVFQLAAIIIPIILAVIKKDCECLFLMYYSLGGVQTISAIVYVLKKSENKLNSRKVYEKLLFTVYALFLFLVLATRDSEPLLMFGFVMLVMGPCMGIWYLLITNTELINAIENKESVKVETDI
jgi:hypothetical protein